MSVQRTARDGSGVSESIGFILMFTIVIAGIGLVTLYGFPLLLQQQSNADEKIMEKNMIVLQNDFKSIVYKTIPYKETSMKIASGALSVNNATDTGPYFTIGDGSGANYLSSYPTGDLRYLSTQLQEEISLQNGAVVKRNLASPGSVMLAQPRWYYDSNTQTLVINIVTVNSSSVMGREGIGTVQMELGQTTYQYISPVTGSVNVYYEPFNSPDYSKAWDNYFLTTFGATPDTSGPGPRTYTLPQQVNVLVIKTTDIIIRSV